MTGADSRVRCRAVALDSGGSLIAGQMPPAEGSHPVDPGCTGPLRQPAARYMLVLPGNTVPGMHRIPTLAATGTGRLFRAVLASACLGIAKPDPAFYAMIPAPRGSVIGTEEKRAAREVAEASGPSGVGPEVVGTGAAGPTRLRAVGPRAPSGNTQTRRAAPTEPIMTEIDFVSFNCGPK
jgi:hypothetical protein